MAPYSAGTAKEVASSMNERRKRTRPVSACENCRSKKVKCVLKPDEPVCEGCSASGKECLFRIDDLSPALRLQRFAGYGPPSEGARQIASRKGPRSRQSHARTASTAEEETPGAGSDEGGDRKRQRQDSEGKGGVKSKAVFRSFANPTKLGAPSQSSGSSAAGASALESNHGMHTTSSQSQAMLTYGPNAGTRYEHHPMAQQAPPYSVAAGTASSSPHRIYGSSPAPPYGYHYQAGSYYEQAPEPHHQPHLQAQAHVPTFQDSLHQPFNESWTPPNSMVPASQPAQHVSQEAGSWQCPPGPPHNYSYSPSNEANYRTSIVQSHEREQRPPSTTLSYPQTALPSFRSAFSTLDSRAGERATMGGPSRERGKEGVGRPRSSTSGSRYPALTPPKPGDVATPFDVAHRSTPMAGVSPSSWTDDSRHSYSSNVRQTPTTLHPTRIPRSNTSTTSFLLPPPVLSTRQGLTPAAGSEDKHGAQSASPANQPYSRNDLAASQEGMSAEQDSEGRGSGPAPVSLRAGAASVDGSASSTSRNPPTFKKIALPFFRWFGATANTPGIRRIKVGVYHETDVEEVHEEADQGREVSGGEVAEEVGLESPALGSDRAAVDGPREATPRDTAPAKSTPRLVQPGGESALSTSARELFESDRPRYPRRDILVHLVNLFIKSFKASCFPWLDEVELVAGAQSGELPAILANAICAITARFSNHVDLRKGSSKSSGEPFADMAKVLIVPMLSWPSVDVIETLVIISYAEFAAGADAGLWMYIGMALRMATDLGLQHEVTIKSMASKKLQDRARLLFWAIVGLDRITCFGTGRTLTVREDSFDCELPPLEEEPSSDGFVFGHIVRTLLKRGRIGELLNRRTDELSLEERGRKLRSMWLDLAEYYDSLPTTLHFGVNTFRRLAAANQGGAFVYLHVLLQSTLSLLNRPSLLRRFDKDFSISAPSKLASIANHASGTIVSILRFAEDARHDRATMQDGTDENPMVNPYIDCTPYLDQLILPAGRAFLSEREAVREALRRLGYAAQSRPVSRGGSGGAADSKEGSESASFAPDGPFNGLIASRQYAQTNLATCQKILDRLALWWSGASWPARALRQETAGATGNDVEPDGNDEDAQPAPIRDVEMVLKWAKARVKRNRAINKTPLASRRASVDAQAPLAATMGAESSSVDVNQEISSFLGNHYSAGADSSSPDDSPFGLGFSGSFGTTTDIDIQALINAWADEHNFIDSTQQQQATVTPLRAQEWSVSDQYDKLATQSAFAPPLSHPSDLAGHRQTTGIVDLDLNAMQLEEFFFKPDLDQSGSQLHNGINSSQDDQAAGPVPQSTAGVANEDFNDLAGLDELPSALFNAFAFHAGAPAHDYNSSLAQPASRLMYK